MGCQNLFDVPELWQTKTALHGLQEPEKPLGQIRIPELCGTLLGDLYQAAIRP